MPEAKAMANEKPIQMASKYVDVTKASEIPSEDSPTSEMSTQQDRKNVFWNGLNVRLTIINAIVVAVVAIAGAWTSNAIQQAALAQRVDNIEKTEAGVDKKLDAMDNKMLTKESFGQQIKPIIDTQADVKRDVGEIKGILLRQALERPASTPLPLSLK